MLNKNIEMSDNSDEILVPYYDVTIVTESVNNNQASPESITRFSENATKKLVKKRIELDDFFKTHRKKQSECWQRLLNELGWDHIAVEKVKKKWQNANKEYSVWRKKCNPNDQRPSRTRPSLEYMQLLHEWYQDQRIDTNETAQAISELSNSLESEKTIINSSEADPHHDPNRDAEQECAFRSTVSKSSGQRSTTQINPCRPLKKKRADYFPTYFEEQAKFLNPMTSESSKMLSILNKLTDGWLEYLKYVQRRDFGPSRLKNGQHEESSGSKPRESSFNDRSMSDHHYSASHSHNLSSISDRLRPNNLSTNNSCDRSGSTEESASNAALNQGSS